MEAHRMETKMEPKAENPKQPDQGSPEHEENILNWILSRARGEAAEEGSEGGPADSAEDKG
jgi:hypothetical protein